MSYIIIVILGFLLGVSRVQLRFTQKRLVLAMLRERPGMRSLELAEAGKIPRHTIYPILRTLEDDGLVIGAKDSTDQYGRKRYRAS